MIKYERFNPRERIRVEKQGLFGKYIEDDFKYTSSRQFYDEVTAYIEKMQDKILYIIGSINIENYHIDITNEIVIWYKEGE